MTVKEFKESHDGGFYIYLKNAKPGDAPIWGDCDEMTVDRWLYQPLNGIYSLFVK